MWVAEFTSAVLLVLHWGGWLFPVTFWQALAPIGAVVLVTVLVVTAKVFLSLVASLAP